MTFSTSIPSSVRPACRIAIQATSGFANVATASSAWKLEAGRALDPETDEFIDVGLPWGPKARLVLYHLNAEALKQQTRHIEVVDSLTSFVHRTLNLDPKGRNIRAVKDQLARLSAADFRLGASHKNGRAVTFKNTIIDAFELWAPRNPNQKVLWPTIIQFSVAYFESLMRHAVPLNEQAVTRLSHNAMALDIYTWLAQRLHRIGPKRAAFVPWASLKEQFGQGYSAMNNFKRVFRKTLKQVQIVYQDARLSDDGKGLRLRNSRPPVLPRAFPITIASCDFQVFGKTLLIHGHFVSAFTATCIKKSRHLYHKPYIN